MNSDLKDLFALQDEIIMKILIAVRVELTEGEQAGLVEKYYRGKQGLDCYLKIMEGQKYQELFTIEGNEKARRIAEEAVAMCPEVPTAYHLLATVNTNEYFLVGSSKSPQESIAKAFELAQKSLALDDTQAQIHSYLSVIYCLKREYDKAIAEAERGVALAPGAVGPHYLYGAALINVGRPQEAVTELQKAIRLNPHCRAEVYWNLGYAYLLAGRYEEAVSAHKKALHRSPNSNIPHVALAITYSMMGREKEARAEAAEVLRINPKFSVESWKKIPAYKDQSVTDTFADALRKAGLK